MIQGIEFWVEIYHAEEGSIKYTMAAHMIYGLEECRNVSVQKNLPIPISDVEADCAKECDLFDEEYVTAGGYIAV